MMSHWAKGDFMAEKPWAVVDLFSGAGGMSYGFHAHAGFRIAGAVDAQIGKPSSRSGSLECNGSYESNVGVAPLSLDLMTAAPDDVARALYLPADGATVL